MNSMYVGWMDEEQCLAVEAYARQNCETYQPNWIQRWIDDDAAGVVVSVEPIDRYEWRQQVLVDLAHHFVREAGWDLPTRQGTVYTWRYRRTDSAEEEPTPSAYDVSCYDDDHEHPVVVCLFYCRRDSSMVGGDLQTYPRGTPSSWLNRWFQPVEVEDTWMIRSGMVVVMEGTRHHVHTPCGGRGEMHIIAVALYRTHPEENWFTERW